MKIIKVVFMLMFAVLLSVNIFSVLKVDHSIANINNLLKIANASNESNEPNNTCGTAVYHWHYVGDCAYDAFKFHGSSDYSRTTGNQSWYSCGIICFTDHCDGSRSEVNTVSTFSCN